MSLGTTITNLTVRAGRFVTTHSPEIFMGLGTVATIGGTVMIARKASTTDDVLKKFKDAQDQIKEAKDTGKLPDGQEYSLDDAKHDLFIVKKDAVITYVKTFAPGALVLATGITCFFVAFGIMKKRQGVLVASLAAANKAFDEYRQRVIADQGEEKDKEYLYGLKKETIETIDPETGKKVKSESLVQTSDGMISRYAVIFTPEYATEATVDVNYNTIQLKSLQNTMNALLPSRKKIFLSEVYDELGIDQTAESRLVGWDYLADNFGDGKIEFIITECVEQDNNDPSGYRKYLIVDFNVDGNIANKLPKNAASLGMETQDHVDRADRVIEYT